MPLEAASIEISTHTHKKITIGTSTLFLLSPQSKAIISSSSIFCRYVILSFRGNLLNDVSKEYDIKTSSLRKVFSEDQELSHASWLESIVHRYIFERAVIHKENNRATDFLELEILKEAYYRSKITTEIPLNETTLFKNLPPQVRSSLKIIEENLLDNLDLDNLSSCVSLSKSTLNRLFNRHIGMTPIRYLWARRLTLADFLLRRNEKTVDEIAEITGFQDLSSFNRAYRRQFGKSPKRQLS